MSIVLGMFKIKIDKADAKFSEFIRRRDKYCMRCGKSGTGDYGIVGLQNSHYFGRGRENTRFDPENCDTLCFYCHLVWGSEDREAYREFKINQLGEERHTALMIRARTYKRKDRMASFFVAKQLLKDLEHEYNTNQNR